MGNDLSTRWARLGVAAAFLLSAEAWAHGALEEEGAAQEDTFANVTIETQDLGGGLYMLTGRGGNIGLSVGPDGVFMIDDQYAPLSEKILSAIAEITDQPLRYLVNTHWHGDHTGGNENMAEAGAVIVAHDNVYKRLSTDQFVAAFSRTVPASPAVAWPVITFSEAITFHFNDQEIHIFNVPGAHTDGDALIHFKGANVIHMGDTFFNGFYPFIDIGSGGNINGMITALDTVIEIADDETRIIPGHGPLADKGDAERARDVLATVRGRVMEQAKAGKSLDEIIAMDLLADYDKDWSRFIDGKGIITFAFESMMKAPATDGGDE